MCIPNLTFSLSDWFILPFHRAGPNGGFGFRHRNRGGGGDVDIKPSASYNPQQQSSQQAAGANNTRAAGGYAARQGYANTNSSMQQGSSMPSSSSSTTSSSMSLVPTYGNHSPGRMPPSAPPVFTSSFHYPPVSLGTGGRETLSTDANEALHAVVNRLNTVQTAVSSLPKEMSGYVDMRIEDALRSVLAPIHASLDTLVQKVDSVSERVRRNEDAVVEFQGELQARIAAHLSSSTMALSQRLESLDSLTMQVRDACDQLAARTDRAENDLAHLRHASNGMEQALMDERDASARLSSVVNEIQAKEAERAARARMMVALSGGAADTAGAAMGGGGGGGGGFDDGGGLGGGMVMNRLIANAASRADLTDISTRVQAAEERTHRDFESVNAHLGRLADSIQDSEARLRSALSSTSSRIDMVEAAMMRMQGSYVASEDGVMRLQAKLDDNIQTAVETMQEYVQTLKREFAQRFTNFETVQKERDVEISESLKSMVKSVNLDAAERAALVSCFFW